MGGLVTMGKERGDGEENKLGDDVPEVAVGHLTRSTGKVIRPQCFEAGVVGDCTGRGEGGKEGGERDGVETHDDGGPPKRG